MIISIEILKKAYRHMMQARAMADVYEENRQITKYVHSTSRGHEGIQLAAAYQCIAQDWVSPYYRDEALLLGMGWSPEELMMQLLAKAEDPFSGGRLYYSHPSSRREDRPKMLHNSSATGMQTIPATGIAQGIKYREEMGLKTWGDVFPVSLCSLGDNSVTEGEVSEAFQFAALHQLPIIFLVQDNEWGISVTKEEARTCDAYDFVGGFVGMNRMRVDGTDFEASYRVMEQAFDLVRTKRQPVVVCAKTVLIGHHTSGVRREFYRDEENLALHRKGDPGVILRNRLLERGISEEELDAMERETRKEIEETFARVQTLPEPDPSTVMNHIFAPTPITKEEGEREPAGAEKIVMVDAGIHALQELMTEHPEALLYGQDVGGRIGGVFREAVTLEKKFGKKRVFNTPIQEAYIIGSTAGMSAVGLKPVVEVQFADYIYPGFNQLVTEISKSCYLTMGKYPVSTLIRVPIGAYGGGGPYHSGSVESTLATIKGIKIAYPSNAADFKGLFKAAFHDPNPVVMLEHKGLYWSKVPGTEAAKTLEPAENYILPFGKAKIYNRVPDENLNKNTLCIVTYGMGVHWANEAAKSYPGIVEVIDLRTLVPLDEELVFDRVKKHGRCIILTEEQVHNSLCEALSARINSECFRYLDAPVVCLGALPLPCVPINLVLESAMLPSPEKLRKEIDNLLAW